MDALRKHEIFEIEALERLKNAKLLEPLVFGGGTMLRLCYELNRYSADLDFWFIKKVDHKRYFKRLRQHLDEEYELTDAQIKFYRFLFEFRSKDYPKRLKIEIRKKKKKCDFQDKIAFSKYSTKQVVLRVHTLEQSMENKIEAALDRKDIRDYFDIEFLLRQGVPLTISRRKRTELKKLIESFRAENYSVTLGSVLEPEMRKYYIKNRFNYLLQRLSA